MFHFAGWRPSPLYFVVLPFHAWPRRGRACAWGAAVVSIAITLHLSRGGDLAALLGRESALSAADPAALTEKIEAAQITLAGLPALRALAGKVGGQSNDTRALPPPDRDGSPAARLPENATMATMPLLAWIERTAADSGVVLVSYVPVADAPETRETSVETPQAGGTQGEPAEPAEPRGQGLSVGAVWGAEASQVVDVAIEGRYDDLFQFASMLAKSAPAIFVRWGQWRTHGPGLLLQLRIETAIGDRATTARVRSSTNTAHRAAPSRDPFQSAGAQIAAGAARLLGVFLQGGRRAALIALNGKTLFVEIGATVGYARVSAIEAGRVTLAPLSGAPLVTLALLR